MDVTAAPFVTTTAPIAAEIHCVAKCLIARAIDEWSSPGAKLRFELGFND